MITKNGETLMQKLAEKFPLNDNYSWFAAAEVCSKIHRHAVTLHRMNELLCSDEYLYEWAEKRAAQLEKRIMELAEELPMVEGGLNFLPRFGGDPRGSTVHLTLPGWEDTRKFDNWERDGIYVY